MIPVPCLIPKGGAMTSSTFVGRETEIALLKQTLADGGANHGRVVFIEGEAGTGKSFLLQALQEQVSQMPGGARIRFVFGNCSEDTGEHNAYQPFVEILGSLLAPGRTAGDLGKLFLTILKETGTDWLKMIPGVGPAISAGLKTATIAGNWLFGHQSDEINQSETLSNQYIQSLARIAPRYTPLVLVLEDAHWIDDASCHLLLRLALKIHTQPLVIIVNFRPSYVNEGHPLRNVRNELLAKNLVQVLPLAGLNENEIKTYLVRRFGNPLNPKLAAWLIHLCKGHPLFVTQYLSLFEQDGIIRRAGEEYILDGNIKHPGSEWELEGRLGTVSVPDSMEALLEQRIDRLIEEDQEMLQLGAVQGEYFMSFVLAGLLKKDEADILKRLRKVVEQHHLISLYTGDDVDKTRSDVYAFEHALLHQAFYNKLSPRERVLYHRSIAQLLESISLEQKQPSRKLILEIAHHYDLGEIPASAASFYQSAAQSLLADGANIEATEISRRALHNIRQVANADHQHAEIIELLLTATRWRSTDDTDEATLPGLVDEAENAALNSGDKALHARLKYLCGMRIGQAGNLDQWLKTLQEALDLMHEAGDPVGEFFVMSQLGQEMRGVNFDSGFKLQQKAYQLFQDKIAASPTQTTPGLRRQFYIIQNLLGVARFDNGDYSEALQLLEASIAGFRKLHLKDALAEGLNFLAQLFISLGQFEQAETALNEALQLVKNDEMPHYYNGYNLCLLGKLYLEWGRPDMAAKPIQDGWQESQATTSKVLLPLIKNYYAELLMQPGCSGYNLMEADRVLAANFDESKSSGYHRSAVAALSLRSLVALGQDLPETAVNYSTQAVEYLKKMGTLPALRTEEVLFTHFMVMKAAGREPEGLPYLEQAFDTMKSKAGSIKEDNYRKSFFERVQLNQSIIAAAGKKP